MSRHLKLILVAVFAVMAIASIGTIKRLEADPPDAAPRALTILQSDNQSVMMRQKLTRSKDMLEGLLRNDFRSIARAAKEMKRISEAAEWSRHRDAVYERFSTEFRRQCSELERLSENLNQEGVKFTYLNMTTTCINCHDYVRDSRRVADVSIEGDVRLVPPTRRLH